MEKDGIGYISRAYNAEAFLDLNLQINSAEADWCYAIKIFRDRIESRFWDVIDILETDLYNNGFAIMALNCLLVDTFYQFRDPDNMYFVERRHERYRRNNKTCYIEFLVRNFPNVFDMSSAEYFYTDIRCGILHSAQTKNGSQLTIGKDYVIEVFENDKIKVDINNFTRILREYYSYYIRQLEYGDIIKRKKFIKQMRKICLH